MDENNEVLVEEALEGVEDFTEKSLIFYDKLKRRSIISLISFAIIIFTMFFDKYSDFDVALTSNLFLLLLFVSLIATLSVNYLLFITRLTMNEETVMKKLKKGNKILIDDGKFIFIVARKIGNSVVTICKSKNCFIKYFNL